MEEQKKKQSVIAKTFGNTQLMQLILVIALAVNGGTKELHQRHFLQLFPICLMK